MDHQLTASAFRRVPKTGVIFVTAEAEAKGVDEAIIAQAREQLVALRVRLRAEAQANVRRYGPAATCACLRPRLRLSASVTLQKDWRYHPISPFVTFSPPHHTVPPSARPLLAEVWSRRRLWPRLAAQGHR